MPPSVAPLAGVDNIETIPKARAFSRVPNEILDEIFKHLETADHIMLLAVNRKLRESIATAPGSVLKVRGGVVKLWALAARVMATAANLRRSRRLDHMKRNLRGTVVVSRSSLRTMCRHYHEDLAEGYQDPWGPYSVEFEDLIKGWPGTGFDWHALPIQFRSDDPEWVLYPTQVWLWTYSEPNRTWKEMGEVVAGEVVSASGSVGVSLLTAITTSLEGYMKYVKKILK